MTTPQSAADGAGRGAILIVGGTGQVGSAAAKNLEATGADVRIAGRRSAVRIDHDDPTTYDHAFVGVEAALLATPDRPDSALVQRRLIEAAASAGVGRIVLLSAASAGWSPPASFGVAHAAAEAVLRESTLDWTILRPTVFQETVSLFAADVHKGRLVVPTCRDVVSFVSVSDVGGVASASLLDPSLAQRVLELTGPEAVSFGDIADTAAQMIGRSVRHRNLPHTIARRALPRVAGMSRWMADNVVDLFAGLDRGEQATVTTDVVDVLGRPATRLRDTLPDILRR